MAVQSISRLPVYIFNAYEEITCFLHSAPIYPQWPLSCAYHWCASTGLQQLPATQVHPSSREAQIGRIRSVIQV